MIWYTVNKEIFNQFHVGYMTLSLLKKHITHRYQVIKMFQSELKLVIVQCIKNELSKRNISVISLIMFYENRKILMYKVIGAVIYTIIDDYIFIDYLFFFNKVYRNMTINLKIPSSTICLGWEYLRFWWISCHVMDLLNIQCR